jgi:hypothetical protein
VFSGEVKRFGVFFLCPSHTVSSILSLGEAATAETRAAEHLQWLLEADETALAADQRKIRGQLQQRLGTAKVQAR